MKKRFLPFSFATLVISGLAALFFISVDFKTDEQEMNMDGISSIIKAKEYLAMIRNNQHTGMLDARDVIKARKQIKQQVNLKSSAAELNWIEMGPDNMGGRTRGLIFDNRDAEGQTLYAASVTGGIFKTTNLGATWNKVNLAGDESNLSVSSMIQASDGTVYVGTGEGFNVQNVSAFGEMGYSGGFVGNGIFKADGNDNFTRVEGTEPVANDDQVKWAYVNEIGITDNSKLWAATNTGLVHKSGSDWPYAKYTDSLGASINLEGLAYDVKISSSGLVIAAVDGLVYISSDGSGNGFVLASTGEEGMLPAEGVGRVELAIAPSDPNIIYALATKTTGQDENGLENVYLSEDGGESWRVVGPGGSESLNILGSTYLDGTTVKEYYQGDFNNTLVVFPSDPYKILAGGINLWEGKKINETGYFQWAEKSLGNIPIIFPTYVHNDHHVYVFHPNYDNQFAIGSDGGVSGGSAGSNLYFFQSINKNYNASQFYTVGITDKANQVIGGTQDNGTPYINGESTSPMSGGDVWNFGDPLFPEGGDGGFCAMSNIRYIIAGNETPPVIFYSKGPNPEGSDLGDRMRRSETLGFDFSINFLSGDMSNSNFLTPMILWESYSNENSRDSANFPAREDYTAGDNVLVHSNNYNQPFNFTLPVDLNEGDTLRVKDIVSTKLFVGTTDEIWMTFEALDFSVNPEWFNISNENKAGFEGDPQSMAYTTDANYLFVGTTDGRLFRISNIALAYDHERADVSSTNCIIATDELQITEDTITQVITSISVDPLDANKVLVTLGNYGNSDYIYYTENALSDNPTFTSVQGNLPEMPVYASILEMHTDDAAIVGTEEGIWVSDDVASGEWYQSSTDLGNVPVFALKQQTVYKTNITITHVDPVTGVFYEVYPAIENYGMIYAATHGRGIFREESFKEVGIENPAIVKNNISEIKIYPNPVVNTANLTFNMEQANDVEVNVFDISGRQVNTFQYNNINTGTNTITFNVRNLTKGTYIVKLNVGSKVMTSKFVIVK